MFKIIYPMKKNIPSIKASIFIALLIFPFLTLAQSAVKAVIPITLNLELPVKNIPTIGWNGYKAPINSYPLQISATDTLFFGNTTQRDFVMNGITKGAVTSFTKVYVMNTNGTIAKYGGRLYNYYYFFNTVDNVYFHVDGLTVKTNATFTTSFSSSDNLYTVVRNYNGNAYSEVVSNYSALATSLAGDFSSFVGTEYLDEPLVNMGNLFFFLHTAVLATPVITANGPTTFNTGGSVTLTSSAPSGNTWYNNGAAIAGATGTTYTATTSGSYTVSTTATGFNNFLSNSIQVTVTTNLPLQVSGSNLLNHSGVAVKLRGVNVPSYHSGYVNDVAAVSAAIKNNSKSNCARLIWNSTQFDNAQYGVGAVPYFTLPYLNTELQTYTNLHILPILALHDLTDIDDNSVAGFNKWVVPFWTDPNLIAILKTYQNNLVLNLANEWGATWDGMTGSIFVSTYKALIVQLRNLGINCPVMIDAPNGGANSAFLIANGAALIAADPVHNVLLSVHTYWSQENGAIVNCPADYKTKIDAMAASNLPFVLGEASDWAVRGSDGMDFESTPPVSFVCPGIASANKYAVNYDAILTESVSKGIGFMAWSWYQDGLYVRNIYDQNSGTVINTAKNASGSYAGSWPADMLSTTKTYGLNNATVVPVW